MKKSIKNRVLIIFTIAFLGIYAAPIASAQFPIRIPGVRTTPKPAPSTPQGKVTQSGSGGGNQETMRREFINEFGPYRQSVYYLMQIHNPKLQVGNTSYGPPTDKGEWEKTMKELAEIDASCKSKYAGMTDDPGRLQRGELNNLPATWCTIAANREQYAQQGKVAAVSHQARNITNLITRELDTVENEPEERIGLVSQQMFWETDKWKADFYAKLKPLFDPLDVSIPEDYLDEFITRGYALRDRRIKSGETRTFEQPPHRDAAIESWVSAQMQKQMPGVKILKIGSSYTDWRVFTNRLNVPTSRTKRGWTLIQLPNRPLCQAREWIVKQDYSGGGRYTANKVDSLGYTGILMKCQ